MDNNYYPNLLIKQYYDKPKARKTIQLLASLLPIVPLEQMNEAYNLNTALSQQLAILAKWVGVDKNYPSPRYKTGVYFAMPHIRGTGIELTDAAQSGFQEFNNPQPWNGPFITADDLIFDDNTIADNDLVTLIKLKIIKNNVRATKGKIDSALYKQFGMDLYTTWPQAKVIQYNCTNDYLTAVTIGRVNDWLPRPTDCRIIINNI